MTLMDFYEHVEDQFTPENLKKLLDYYANGDYSNGIVYNSIVCSNSIYNPLGFNSEDYYNYRINIFNKFKNNLLNVKSDDTFYIYSNDNIELLKKLRYKLEHMPEYSNWEEFIEARETIISDEDDEFVDYFLDLEEDIGKPFVSSMVMNRLYESNYDIKHRLYLNIDNIRDGELTINYLTRRCEKDKVPYEIKFWCEEGRSDQIVIYSSTSDLLKYVDYLEDFKKKYPDVVSKIHTPPILTGVYDGWIGYGTEPDGLTHNGSFNSIRSNLIELELDKLISSGVQRAISRKYDYNGEEVSLEDYITYKLTDIVIDKQFLYDNDLKLADNCRESLYSQIKTFVINNLKNSNLSSNYGKVEILLADGSKNTSFLFEFSQVLVDTLKDDDIFINDLYNSIKNRFNENGILEKSCFDDYVIEEMKKVDGEVKGVETEMIYDEKLNEEFLELLKELKNSSYDRKERSKFVIRVEQIIDIYRNQIHNNGFADTLVKAFNNAQKTYEDELRKKSPESLVSPKHGRHFAEVKPKHFKSVSLEEEKPVSLSEDMESKIDDEVNDRVQKIDEDVYKTSSQKVDEMLDKKIEEINKRVDSGETLDSKIDDLSRYVIDLNRTRAELKEKFKDAWISSDEDKFDELLEEDNNTKALINETESEIKRRNEIRDIVDEQIAREEVTRDIEKFESDVNFINNSDLTEEQKKLLVDQIYAEFDKYVEEHPEEKGRSR